ncbi:DUF3014 domain-containing protein [Neiella sp. HB171785]|uniref:DUF3014 domain-containing protein n=1 Tax=Neiella litorisoli TaxID=2771431 RepID=A0A8J6UN49_9GAMM|nr:DUF3014 domain-containing protein [Neiella litorisoli]MBD1391380.1 DUF3014 domain-containing protein [Neiella litorisoli]
MSASQIRNLLIVLALIAVVAVGVVAWLAKNGHEDVVAAPPVVTETLSEPVAEPEPEPQVAEPIAEPEPEVAPEPQPQPEIEPEPPAPEPKLFDFPLPPLDDSDATLLQQLQQKIVSKSVALLVDEGLIEQFVVAVDALSRGQVTYNQLPIERPVGRYKVIEADGKLYGSTANIARYQPYLDLMAGMPREHWVALYQHIYPLLQQAYERLGYPDQQFHSTLLVAIQRVLASPKPSSSVELVQPHVMYEYANEQVQALDAVDKLMIRLGPNLNSKLRLLLEGLQQPLTQWQPE